MVGSRVYVGGLPYGVRERDLEKFFRGFGRTRDILIKSGYGFVEFEDYRDADDAVYELNGKELLGERVVVEPARGIDRGGYRGSRYPERYSRDRDRDRDRDRYGGGGGGGGGGAGGGRSRYEYGPPTRTEYRLIVENLSSRISWQDLKDYMRQAGEVTYADAHKQHRNEGVVEFATYSDLKAAIEKLDGTELNGRRIKLVEDRRSRKRSRSSSSRSRSRSRKRSRSRSRSRRSSRSKSRSKSRAKSKSPAAKSRSRSRSKGRRSASKSPARKSATPRKSRSHSPSRERSRSRSKNGSVGREKDAKSASRSRSPRSGRSRSRSQSRSRSRSRSRSQPARQNGDADARNSSERSPRSGE